MGKKKKKRNHNPLYAAIEPFAKNPGLLWPVLGAAGAGVVLARAFGTDTVRGWLAVIGTALQNPAPARQDPGLLKAKKKKRKEKRVERMKSRY